MPTTIFDSSLITQRNRDKIIAQSVKQRNAAGISIITPQAGYASYTIEDVDNGEITAFRKVGQCTNIDLACSCYGNTPVAVCNTVYTPGDFEITATIIPTALTVLISIGILGPATVYWGDGTFDTYTTSGNKEHTYSCAGDYIITIQGVLTTLTIASSQGSGSGGIPYPRVQLLNIKNNGENLISLITRGNIINLPSCINLEILYLRETTMDLTPIYTLTTTLTSLSIDNYLGNSSFVSPFVNSFPNLTQLYIIFNTPLTGITTLYDAPSPVLTNLNLSNTPISSVPALPTSLTSLTVDFTSINLATLPTSLSLLTSLTTLSISSIPNTNFSTYSLATLPPSITQINMFDNITITTLAALDVTNKLRLLMNGCSISQVEADALATRLVTAGKLNGTLTISEQSTGTLTITGGPWNTLLSRNWTIG